MSKRGHSGPQNGRLRSSGISSGRPKQPSQKAGETCDTGQILYGISNIYAVAVGGGIQSCRIKGKILRGSSEPSYNPLAVGDWVRVLPDPHSSDKGWISERSARKSSLVRFNRKRNAPQVIAANVDQLICVTSAKEPPFRPRFIDRMLISAQIGNIEPLIFVNKSDLGIGEPDRVRLQDFQDFGCLVFYGSALTGDGLPELKERLRGKLSVFAGQSGVGKSLLLNRIFPGLDLKIGDLSRKYNRGGHTTNYAIMLEQENGCRVIDTPGIRELDIYGITPRQLAFYFPEFAAAGADCEYTPCLHIGEPGCRVKERVELGTIHRDRYASYTRIYETLKRFQKEFPERG